MQFHLWIPLFYVFWIRLGYLLFKDFCENASEEPVPHLKFYEEVSVWNKRSRGDNFQLIGGIVNRNYCFVHFVIDSHATVNSPWGLRFFNSFLLSSGFTFMVGLKFDNYSEISVHCSTQVSSATLDFWWKEFHQRISYRLRVRNIVW